MELLGPDGHPIKMPLDSRVGGLERNLQVTFSLVEQLRMEMFNQALKTQFLIKKLSEQGLMPTELNTEFQAFVAVELARMEEEQKAQQPSESQVIL